MVLDPSGLPLVISIPGTSYEVRRLTRAGALDPTYGTGGIAPIAWDGQAAFRVNAIALAKGGLLAVLYNEVSSRIVRLTANGGVADAFPGSPTRDVPDAYLEVVDELADGRLLLSRHDANGKTTLERWRADGKPDTAFGTAGKVDVTALIGSGAGVLATPKKAVASSSEFSPSTPPSASRSAMSCTSSTMPAAPSSVVPSLRHSSRHSLTSARWQTRPGAPRSP